MEEMMKSKDDVYINWQFKHPMLPSSGEPLVDIPERMFSKEYLSKHGIVSQQIINLKPQIINLYHNIAISPQIIFVAKRLSI
jgi:hypothetical protein